MLTVRLVSFKRRRKNQSYLSLGNQPILIIFLSSTVFDFNTGNDKIVSSIWFLRCIISLVNCKMVLFGWWCTVFLSVVLNTKIFLRRTEMKNRFDIELKPLAENVVLEMRARCSRFPLLIICPSHRPLWMLLSWEQNQITGCSEYGWYCRNHFVIMAFISLVSIWCKFVPDQTNYFFNFFFWERAGFHCVCTL